MREALSAIFKFLKIIYYLFILAMLVFYCSCIGLSLAAESRATLNLMGISIVVLLSLQSWGSRAVRLSSCGAQA